MIGKLVAHHDHIEDFMSVVLGELSKDVSIEALSAGDALSFIRRGVPLFTRFDRVVICEDCNNAESTGKRLVGADRYFTFTPKEIAAFLRMSPNTAHSLDESALGEIYASAQRHYDLRIAAIKKLAERAFKGTAWYEPVEFGDREEQVDRRAQLALKLFGLDDVGLRAVRDIFLTTEKIAAEHASAWRTKKSVPSRAPSEQEIEFVTRGNVKFESLPEGWRCPCCMRSKRDVIRWSHNSKKFMFVVVTRKVPEATARFGTRQITLCDACNHIFQEVYKELRVASGNVSVPDDLIDLDDVRAVIAPAAHSLHDVKSDAAQMLVSKCLPLLEVE
ncbi:hypothetical protein [Hyphomicrobium sp.]|uniref:hypothetical protein n=1 Tax=Hyphomicrobium sp. TaxID=82 RepID=UPI000FA1B6EC|nr:hypothetical protein [Hyphomicrobium sp.]RUP07824.1 MAG: hypothetical protein EKK38_17750 [Hyphomicrobium sp.]